MDKIKSLYSKYREIIVYLIVGVLTTLVSWTAAFLGKLVLNMEIPWQNFLNNSFCWIAGVSFAYPLNRKWVFKSTNPKILKEFFGFASSRVSTWVLDVIIMWLFVNVWSLERPISYFLHLFSLNYSVESLVNINYWVAKIVISSVFVTIANYLISKFLIFKKSKQ